MNLREEIMREHSKEHALQVANYACSSPKHFAELINCFLDKEYRVAQRAAWSVSWAARKNPKMVMPHIGKLVAQLQRTDVHDAVIRNSVRVLEAIDIPEEYHGNVMNACFEFIEKTSTPAAIKAFSLTTLFRLSKYYPEIKPELKLIIEDRWDNESPAFKSRGRKILKALE